MSDKMTNKVVMITGAGRGIGRAAALEFARAGAALAKHFIPAAVFRREGQHLWFRRSPTLLAMVRVST